MRISPVRAIVASSRPALMGLPPDPFEDPGDPSEPLHKRVSRMRARWLKRVMYNSQASSSEKCLAYSVFDHLNCVTLDSWPGQPRLAELLGFVSTKSIQRAGNGLVAKGYLTIRQYRRGSYRYAPVFLPNDDIPVPKSGHLWLIPPDKSVRESLLLNQLTIPAPTATDEARKRSRRFSSQYSSPRRGAAELALAEMLGPDGMEVLGRLAAMDDAHVARLCRAYAAGAVGERELAAARLAAQQAR